METSQNDISISPSVYLRELLKIWFPLQGLLLMTPALVLAFIGGWYDLRFLIVALAYLFMICPMVMIYLYYYFMLTPAARRSMLPREIEVDPGKHITIHYLKLDDVTMVPEDETIEWESVKNVYLRPKRMVFLLHGKTMPLIIVENQTENP